MAAPPIREHLELGAPHAFRKPTGLRRVARLLRCLQGGVPRSGLSLPLGFCPGSPTRSPIKRRSNRGDNFAARARCATQFMGEGSALPSPLPSCVRLGTDRRCSGGPKGSPGCRAAPAGAEECGPWSEPWVNAAISPHPRLPPDDGEDAAATAHGAGSEVKGLRVRFPGLSPWAVIIRPFGPVLPPIEWIPNCHPVLDYPSDERG
jgi:hypothetical protein